MLEQIERRTGQRPAELLIDGGFVDHASIERATAGGTTVYGPVPQPRAGDARDPYEPREQDSEAVAAWRRRMATEDAKSIYRDRAATAETVNADAKAHRGLDRLSVRGRNGALSAACLFALTYDILRLIALGA
jgi:hypothetical protein